MERSSLAQRLFINRNYGLLFFGRLVSQIGDGIHYFALAWLVLDITGSGTALGTLLTAAALPGILLSPFSGVLADLLDRKRIVVLMDFIRGSVVLLLALLNANGQLTLPILYGATVVISLCSVLFFPAISAVMPSLVKKEELVQANARDSFSHSATGIIGPIIGAILLGLFGYTGVFLINGISFIISGISEMFIEFPKLPKADLSNGPLKQFSLNFKEGIQFIWNVSGIRALILFGVFLNFLMSPLFSVFFPYFGKEILMLNPEMFGFVQSGFPAGMLIGTLIVGVTTQKFSKSTLLSASITLEGLILVALSLLAMPYIYSQLSALGITLGLVIPMVLIGALNVQVNVPLHVMLQETVPENYRGRVFGLLGSMLQVLTPISMSVFGILVDVIPAYFFLILVGAVVAALGVAMGLSRSIKGLYTQVQQ